MILVALITIPFLGGLLAWLSARWGSNWPRWISLAALSIDLVITVALWICYFSRVGCFVGIDPAGTWLADCQYAWIPQLGVTFHLAMDGISLLLVLLAAFLGLASVICSWNEIQTRVGFFHFNLMATLTGIIGVFLAVDLVLFAVLWEVMLVPMYFLIACWGHENRAYAAVKFFIFTQAGGLLMMLAIIGLYFVHGAATGIYTFDYFALLNTPMSRTTAMWLMLGFMMGFAVKIPAVPLHTWLPDAHTEAPTAGSVILAGLLLKTGAYGVLRFVLPLFPAAADEFATVFMVIAEVGILYGAMLAFAQTDLKRLVAYTSVSHMGFVLLGLFDRNELALQGAVMQMICHGIGTGSLFILVGSLQERIHTRDVGAMGGLWSAVPRMGGVALFFALASLGLPGLGNFVGEVLVLAGTYERSVWLAIPAVEGIVFAALYSLVMIWRAFQGPKHEEWQIRDLTLRESGLMGIMVLTMLWLGLFPQPVLNTAAAGLKDVAGYTRSIQGVATEFGIHSEAGARGYSHRASAAERGERSK